MKLYISVLLILLWCPVFVHGQNQASKDFGVGKVTIKEYHFSPQITVPAVSSDSFSKFLHLTHTYFIKHSLVLRKDSVISPSISTSENNTLSVRIFQPWYLINWKTHSVTALADNKHFVAEFDIKDFALDLFYRSFLEDKDRHIDTLYDHKKPVNISSFPCYSALATINGEKFTFFFTKKKMGVISPLNCFLPRNFKYAVMYIILKVPYTLPSGKIAIGHIAYQVSNFQSINLSTDLFTVPVVEVKRNVPLTELIKN